MTSNCDKGFVLSLSLGCRCPPWQEGTKSESVFCIPKLFPKRNRTGQNVRFYAYATGQSKLRIPNIRECLAKRSGHVDQPRRKHHWTMMNHWWHHLWVRPPLALQHSFAPCRNAQDVQVELQRRHREVTRRHRWWLGWHGA